MRLVYKNSLRSTVAAGLQFLFLLVVLLSQNVVSFVPSQHHYTAIRLHQRRYFTCKPLKATEKVSHKEASNSFLTPKVIDALDLVPLLHRIAHHTGTRRGYEAIVSLVEQEDSKLSSATRRLGSRVASRRSSWLAQDSSSNKNGGELPRQAHRYRCSEANTIHDARRLYNTLEEAILALQNNTWPPIYSPESSPLVYNTQIVDTDDDEWLQYSQDTQFELQDVLKAEQVVKRLLSVYQWADDESRQLWMPQLSTIGKMIDQASLQALYHTLQETVEIVRVRSAMDPSAKSSFVFRLNSSLFPTIKLLRQREEVMMKKQLSKTRKPSRELESLQEEIAKVESEIKDSLAGSILAMADCIDDALNCVAELDTVFAKAGFGLQCQGQIPQMVRAHGCIDVERFVHPLLWGTVSNPVPVDLKIASGSHKDKRALIISGSNGGGKTLALKSFGLVAVLSRLGIAIPSDSVGVRPRVDFFHQLLVSVGDNQDVSKGESTYVAQLTTYSSFIEQLKAENFTDKASLILLDELGGGTEGNAGGAIAQAILEEILHQNTRAAVVATTHSTRLKTLSFESDEYECASVISDRNDQFSRPTYQLQYGIIGESEALSAASRCIPPLPEGVLNRASELLYQGGGGGQTQSTDSGDASIDFLRALSQSVSKQAQMTEENLRQAEAHVQNMAKCQRAMLTLGQAYERRLALMEARIERCYQSLKEDNTNSLELLGETLDKLRVVKKEIQTESDILKERGLKLLPVDCTLREGETVVIVCEGEWDGTIAKVAAQVNTTRANNEVFVIPSFNPQNEEMFLRDSDDLGVRPIAFPRHQLAVWDYIDLEWGFERETSAQASTNPGSRGRLMSVLSALKIDDKKLSSAVPATTQTRQYKSSRERKASKVKKGKRGKG